MDVQLGLDPLVVLSLGYSPFPLGFRTSGHQVPLSIVPKDRWDLRVAGHMFLAREPASRVQLNLKAISSKGSPGDAMYLGNLARFEDSI